MYPYFLKAYRKKKEWSLKVLLYYSIKERERERERDRKLRKGENNLYHFLPGITGDKTKTNKN